MFSLSYSTWKFSRLFSSSRFWPWHTPDQKTFRSSHGLRKKKHHGIKGVSQYGPSIFSLTFLYVFHAPEAPTLHRLLCPHPGARVLFPCAPEVNSGSDALYFSQPKRNSCWFCLLGSHYFLFWWQRLVVLSGELPLPHSGPMGLGDLASFLHPVVNLWPRLGLEHPQIHPASMIGWLRNKPGPN